MRVNQPVTQREFNYADDATLMSTTDTSSRITYANSAFETASGFSQHELLGQPHNMVRHPDMPREAFADMWNTLKAGYSWTALVKNRRCNGDHYWVRANATPVHRSGRLVGYMSVRTKPARDEVQQAEQLYQSFREGRAGGRKFYRGLLVRTGWLGWLSLRQTLPVRWRLRLLLGSLAAAFLAAGVLSGVPQTALAAFAGATALATVAVLWMLERSIAGPLEQVLKQAQSVAAGQPGRSVQLDRVDEIGLILRSVNQAGLNVRSLVDDVSEQAIGVQSASSEIAVASTDLSSRTEETAASLEETAATIEELSATVESNAKATREAANLAHAASEAAGRGNAVVGKAVETMRAMADSGQQMAGIIGLIDSIAFQTNLLALNAAVEAARAAEHGRGFAVVADEVRNLAQRSAAAAKQISTLISDSTARISNGVEQVTQAGANMSEIVEQVRRVSTLIGEISHATHEQSGGINQVNTVIMQLDQMTQQNAAMVEQSAAAAQSLRVRAARLTESVGVFKSEGPGAAQGLPAATASKPHFGTQPASRSSLAA